MPLSTPSVSFVIPTFRRPHALSMTLDAIARVDYPPSRCEVVVVDNAGDELTAAVTLERAAGLNVRYEVERTPGAAAARNHGARAATGELLIFCDDDILVDASHVQIQLETRARYGDCLVNGHWYFEPATARELASSPFGRYRLRLEDRFRAETSHALALDHDCWQVDALSACNLAISRELFLRLGGFDAHFPFAGAEDREFSVRAARAGAPLIRNDAIVVLHNDQTMSFRQFCTREERSAQTVGVLATKDETSDYARAFFTVNGPLSRADGFQLAVKKFVKRLLALPPLLGAAHLVIRGAEALPLSEATLTRLYTALVGVHIQRGFRRALKVS